MDEQMIISVAEFRKISKLASDVVTDNQVLEIIRQLDTMAQIYIKQTSASLKEETKNDTQHIAVPKSTLGY